MFTTLFDRTDDYTRLEEISELKAKVSELNTSALRRALKPLRRSFEAVSSIDFFSGAGQAQTVRALDEVEAAALAILSPDEPHAAAGKIEGLERSHYQGRIWATRKRPWIDRLASAWLIRRFIDRKAQFLWLENRRIVPVTPCCDRALPRCRWDPVPEAAGLESLLAGARLSSKTDEAFLREAQKSLDYLYAAFSDEVSNLHRGELMERGIGLGVGERELHGVFPGGLGHAGSARIGSEW